MRKKGIIVQVDMDSEFEYICEEDFTDSECMGYIEDSQNRIEDIKQVLDNKEGLELGKDEDGYFFTVTDKEKYFSDKFLNFHNTIKELASWNIKDFTKSKTSVMMKALNDNYEEEYFYAYHSDSIEPFDSYIRFVDVGKKIYIGGVLSIFE